LLVALVDYSKLVFLIPSRARCTLTIKITSKYASVILYYHLQMLMLLSRIYLNYNCLAEFVLKREEYSSPGAYIVIELSLES